MSGLYVVKLQYFKDSALASTKTTYWESLNEARIAAWMAVLGRVIPNAGGSESFILTVEGPLISGLPSIGIERIHG